MNYEASVLSRNWLNNLFKKAVEWVFISPPLYDFIGLALRVFPWFVFVSVILWRARSIFKSRNGIDHRVYIIHGQCRIYRLLCTVCFGRLSHPPPLSLPLLYPYSFIIIKVLLPVYSMYYMTYIIDLWGKNYSAVSSSTTQPANHQHKCDYSARLRIIPQDSNTQCVW